MPKGWRWCDRFWCPLGLGRRTGHRPSTSEPVNVLRPANSQLLAVRSQLQTDHITKQRKGPHVFFLQRPSKTPFVPGPTRRRPLAAVRISSPAPAPAASRAQNCGGAMYGGTR
ncbi:hypothetical protein BDA96_02G353100 [Sorghum bicolor]|uniref:Uncharacterized protein n=1 Tax=Sorghum bicolor TaxID=4558 RepID=A0A921UVH1_SORBI|nr:hypothetical protein BDA96_02G353100 [Sorghum bicolor]